MHYLSGFFGPLERALLGAGSTNIEFSSADFRRFGPLLETAGPARDDDGGDAARRRRLVFAASRLHAGGTVGELRRAGADPERLLVVEVSDAYPTYVRARREAPPRAYTSTRSTSLCARATPPLALPGEATRRPPTPTRRSRGTPSSFIPSGATLQVGIGSIPNRDRDVCSPRGTASGYGLHSEMFTDGCMKLHRAGKISNARKGQYDGVSVTTFAFGSKDLYAWLDENSDVAFLPVDIVNSPEVIGANANMISVNGALAIDIHGQVVADTINGGQFSGIGGAEDFDGWRWARAVGPFINMPALDVREGRRAAVADRAVVQCGRGHHHAAALRSM